MLIYLACEYTGNEEENYQKSLKASVKLIKLGFKVINTIGMWHEAAKLYDLPGDYLFWKELNHEYIHHCDYVLVLDSPTVGDSEGVKDELWYAGSIDKWVVRMTYEEDGTVILNDF